MAILQFNAAEVSPESEFTPLPAGIYHAQITESDLKQTKSGTGQYLQLTWTIIDGQYAGRKAFDRLNITNANETAEKIGRQQLSQLCHAVNVIQLTNSQQLHMKPCRIKLTIRKDDQYGDSNEIKGYEAVAGMTQAANATPAFMAPPVAKPAATTPWGAKAA